MHFQLFIPHVSGQNPQMLVDVGLADLISGAEFFPLHRRGPEDLPGTIVAWRNAVDHRAPQRARIGHYSNQQTWIPAVPRGDLPAARYYLGLWNDDPLQPADIARAYQTPGVHFSFGDGREWLLPQAKELPHDLIRGDDGGWEMVLQREYHAFGLESQRLMRYFGGKPTTWNLGECADFIETALRINYRLVPELASQLRLFNSSNVLKACFAIWSVSA